MELATHIDALQLFKLALAYGINIAPGPVFSASRRFRHCIRLNYGNSWISYVLRGHSSEIKHGAGDRNLLSGGIIIARNI